MGNNRIQSLRQLVCESDQFSELMFQLARTSYFAGHGSNLVDDVLSCCHRNLPEQACTIPLRNAWDKLQALNSPQRISSSIFCEPASTQEAFTGVPLRPLVVITEASASGGALGAMARASWVTLGLSLLVASSPAPGDPSLLRRQKTSPLFPFAFFPEGASPLPEEFLSSQDDWVPIIDYIRDMNGADEPFELTSGTDFIPPREAGTLDTSAPFDPKANHRFSIIPATFPQDDETDEAQIADKLLQAPPAQIYRLVTAHLTVFSSMQSTLLATKLALRVCQNIAERIAQSEDFETTQHHLMQLQNILLALRHFLHQREKLSVNRELLQDMVSCFDTFTRTVAGFSSMAIEEVLAGETDAQTATHEIEAHLFEPKRTRLGTIIFTGPNLTSELILKFGDYLLKGKPRVIWDPHTHVLTLLYPEHVNEELNHSLHSALRHAPSPPEPNDPTVEAFLHIFGWKMQRTGPREIRIFLGNSPYSVEASSDG